MPQLSDPEAPRATEPALSIGLAGLVAQHRRAASGREEAAGMQFSAEQQAEEHRFARNLDSHVVGF